MGTFLKTVFLAALAALLVAGCASHPHDFVPNGSGVNLAPTNPAHIQVLESVPRGMVIGTVMVDRAAEKNSADIIEQARQKAAAAGGDFIVWEDSLGTSPTATPAPGSPAVPEASSGALGHATSLPGDSSLPEQSVAEKTPKARFTVGIFLPEGRRSGGQ